MTWYELLKSWREGKGLTQAAAAELAGASQATWCDWENGKKTPQLTGAADLQTLTEGAVTLDMITAHARAAKGAA